MRTSALLVLLSLTAYAGRFDRFTSRGESGRGDRGLLPYAPAAVEVFNSSGTGTFGACSSTQPTGVTSTRATVAECISQDGQTITQVPSGIARVMTGRTDDSVLGILWEPTNQNDALRSRDLSNAAWTKTNMTCTRTANGMRGGDANGASTCTASAANATVTQTIARAATGACFSAFIKRRTGTGAVSFARDGATFTDVSASLSSTLWKRAVGNDAIGTMGGLNIIVPGLCASTLNPAITIKLTTNGDAVDIDFVQEEVSAGASPWATTPMDTAGAAAVRNGEIHDLVVSTLAASYPTYSTSASMVVPAARGVVTSDLPKPHGIFGNVAAPGAGVPTLFTDSYELLTRFFVAEDSQTNASFDSATGLQITETPATTRSGTYYDGTKLNGCVFGLCGPGTARTFTPANRNVIRLGAWSATSAVLGGVFKLGCLDPSPTRCRDNPPTAAWIGDSIVAGTGGGIAYAPPWQLQTRSGTGVTNLGTAGNTAANCATAYTNSVAGLTYRSLVWSCGVNDFIAGQTGATVWATTLTPLNAAVAAGMHVVVTQVMPWAGNASWSAPKQVQSDAYNTLAQAWALANGQSYVATKATMGIAGGDTLLAAYDSGDGLHPTIAGQIQLSVLVTGGAP